MRGRWVDDLIVRTRSTVDELLERADRRPVLGVTLRCVRDLISIEVRDRIFGMAGQSFLALVPLMVIFASLLTFGNANLAGIINARLELDQETAATVSSLFTADPSVVAGTSVLSAVILLLSVNSFTRTLRRSIERPWQLPKAGWRAQLAGLLAVGVLLVMHFATAALATAWRGGPVATALPEVLVQTTVSVAFWWLISYLLAAGRVRWTHLLPGAVAGGVAQSFAGLWSITFLPSIIEKNVDRYGAIGVALGIVTWLLVMSAITVGVGIVGARIAGAVGWLGDDGALPHPAVSPGRPG